MPATMTSRPASPPTLLLHPLTLWQVLMCGEEKATSALPSSQLIKQSLAYAKELERIV